MLKYIIIITYMASSHGQAINQCLQIDLPQNKMTTGFLKPILTKLKCSDGQNKIQSICLQTPLETMDLLDELTFSTYLKCLKEIEQSSKIKDSLTYYFSKDKNKNLGNYLFHNFLENNLRPYIKLKRQDRKENKKNELIANLNKLKKNASNNVLAALVELEKMLKGTWVYKNYTKMIIDIKRPPFNEKNIFPAESICKSLTHYHKDYDYLKYVPNLRAYYFITGRPLVL